MSGKFSIILFIAFFLSGAVLFAQSEENSFDDEARGQLPPREERVQDLGENFAGKEKKEEDKAQVKPEAPKKKVKKQMKNRTVEIGIGLHDAGFANSFFGTGDIFENIFKIIGIGGNALIQYIKDPGNVQFDPNGFFRQPIEINLDDFFRGLRIDAGASIDTVSLNLNVKNKWGIGLDIAHIDVTGNISIPEELILFEEIDKKKFGAGVAAFADVGIPVFFHIGGAKVKIRPAVYLPLVYVEPDINYSYVGTRMQLDYDIRVYSPIKLDIDSGSINFPNFSWPSTLWEIIKPDYLGYDFSFGLELPLFSWLDLGIDFTNIPIPGQSSVLNHYLYLADSMWIDPGLIDIDDIISGGSFDIESIYSRPDFSSGILSKTGKSDKIRRPFKMLAYAEYRPFNTRGFTLIPAAGFSYNRIYADPAAFEGGLSLRLSNKKNSYNLTLGVNYMDRLWKNSISSVTNWRLIQFESAFILQSQDFVKSWRGAGFAFSFGLKMGI